jgi:hypothetical protein
MPMPFMVLTSTGIENIYRIRCIKAIYVNWNWGDLLITWLCKTYGICRQPVTAKGRVRSQGFPCGICGGLSSTWTGFSSSTSVSPRHCQSLIYHWRYITLSTDRVVKYVIWLCAEDWGWIPGRTRYVSLDSHVEAILGTDLSPCPMVAKEHR